MQSFGENSSSMATLRPTRRHEIESLHGQARRIPAKTPLRPHAGTIRRARRRQGRGQARPGRQTHAPAKAETATVGSSPRGRAWRHVRGAEAPGNAAALRFPAGDRWDAEILGGPQRTFAEPCRQAPGGDDRGSPVGLRQFRRKNSRGQLRRRDGNGVGSRDVPNGGRS